MKTTCYYGKKKTFTFVTSLIINVFFSSSSGETVGGATGLRGFTGRSLQSQTNTSKLKLLKTSEDKIPGSHSKKMARKEGFFSKFCLRLLIGQSQHWGQEWDFSPACGWKRPLLSLPRGKP